MKLPARLSSALPLIVVIIGVLYFVMTTRAQEPETTLDATPPPVATVTQAPVRIIDGDSVIIVPGDVPPIVYVALFVLVVVLLAVMVYSDRLIKLASGLLSPEVARELVQSALSVGGEVALDLAGQTPTKIDEKAIATYYGKKGYTVTQLEDGSWHIEPPKLVPTPAATPVAAAPTTTINITNNDAPPAGGAPAEGSEGFPSAAG